MIWQKWYAFIVLVFYHSNMFTLFQTSLWWPSAIMINFSFWIFWVILWIPAEKHQNFGSLKKNTASALAAATMTKHKQNVPEVALWLEVFSRNRCSLNWQKCFLGFFSFCEAISCIGDFSIFLYALSCFDLFAYAACLCMCVLFFLHEANVAVEFSFSLLSLCDIVYWETKKTNKQMWTKKFLFQKRILWYGLLLPFVMILMKSSFFPFFKNVLHSLLSYWLLKSFAFLFSTFSSFLRCLQKGMFMWHMQNLPSPSWHKESCWGSPRGTVIHTTQEIPSDQSVDASRPLT